MHTDGLVTAIAAVAAVGRRRGGVVWGRAGVVGGRGGDVGRGRRSLHGGGGRAHMPLLHVRWRRGVTQPPLAIAVEVAVAVS